MRSIFGLAAGDDAQLLFGRGRCLWKFDRHCPEAIPRVYWLPVRFKPELQRGTAGLPAGLPGLGSLAGIALPACGQNNERERGRRSGIDRGTP